MTKWPSLISDLKKFLSSWLGYAIVMNPDPSCLDCTCEGNRGTEILMLGMIDLLTKPRYTCAMFFKEATACLE